MKNISKVLILASISICACTSEPIPEERTPTGGPVLEEPVDNVIPGRLYVEFSDASVKMIEAGEMDAVVPGVAVKTYRKVFSDNPKFSRRHHEAGLDKWYVIEFDESIPSTKAAADVREAYGVESVSYPRKIKLNSLAFPFNDPNSYMQWNLSNDGRLNQKLGTQDFKEGCDINVLPVWAEYTAGSSDVIVAVIDEGVFADYEDLSPVVIPFGEGGSKNFVNDSFEMIPSEHGTHVASIIGAVNNNGKCISSVAGGSDGTGGVRIMSCVIANGDDWADQCEPFVWAADNGAVICNNSWGFVFDAESEAAEYSAYFNGRNNPLRAAIDYFIDYAGYDENGNQVGPVAGGTVIFAAGNDSWAHASPASYERVIAVGAHGPSFEFSYYSNYGSWVDVVAPGGDISGQFPYRNDYRAVLGAAPKKGYLNFMQGTSQAAPHVSGVAALIASYYGGPGFTNEMLCERLVGGARPDVLKGRMSGPVLDAYGAFNYARKPVSISTYYTGNFTVKSHEKFEIEYRISNNTYSQLPVEVETDCPFLKLESSYSSAIITVDALDGDPGQYQVKLFVGKGTAQEVSESFVLTILENHAPAVAKMIDDKVVPTTGATVSLAEAFSDQDGETLTYTVTSSDANIISAEVKNGAVSIEPMTYGIAELTVTARDARQAQASQTFKVLSRNTSKPFDVYPNPVTDYMYVRPGNAPASLDIEVIGDFGRKVIVKTASGTPFEPVKLDMTTLDPGQYLVVVKDASGNEFIQNIVKF